MKTEIKRARDREIKAHPFRPDYAVHPGVTIRETMEHLGLSVADVARRSGISVHTMTRILAATTRVTTLRARRLEAGIAIPSRLLRSMQTACDRLAERQRQAHYRSTNPERVKALSRAWDRANPEKRKRIRRKNYKKTFNDPQQRTRRWVKAHSEYHAQYMLRYRRIRGSLPRSVVTAERRAARDAARRVVCCSCGIAFLLDGHLRKRMGWKGRCRQCNYERRPIDVELYNAQMRRIRCNGA